MLILLIAALILNLIDQYITYQVLHYREKKGDTTYSLEKNPLSRWVMKKFGLMKGLIVKLAIESGLIVGAYFLKEPILMWMIVGALGLLTLLMGIKYLQKPKE